MKLKQILITAIIVTVALTASTAVSAMDDNGRRVMGIVFSTHGISHLTLILLMPNHARPTWFRKQTEPSGCARDGSGYDYNNCWGTI